jgi:hypothetical protein
VFIMKDNRRPLRAVRLQKALVLHTDASEELHRLARALGGPVTTTSTAAPVSVVIAKKASGHWIVFGPDTKGCADVTSALRDAGIPVDVHSEERNT